MSFTEPRRFTSDDLIQAMERRGYMTYSFNRSNNALTSIQFLTNFNSPAPHLNVTVKTTPEEFGYFTASYIVPRSINYLTTPECSLIMDDKHFDQVVGKLKEQAKLLDDFYNISFGKES